MVILSFGYKERRKSAKLELIGKQDKIKFYYNKQLFYN